LAQEKWSKYQLFESNHNQSPKKLLLFLMDHIFSDNLDMKQESLENLSLFWYEKAFACFAISLMNNQRGRVL
jgi:hypothetical protein